MPRIIAKFGYMQPNNKKRSRFLEYIATREGVIKNLTNISSTPATKLQQEYIRKLISNDVSIKNTLQYKEYIYNKTIGNASELIAELEEKELSNLNNSAEFLQYIAERPRVVKEDSHGLFTSNDEKINLSEVKREISNHKGNIWTAIISLKREDAVRLSYDDLKSWKVLTRALQNTLAENLKIDYQNFKWYGAFHNEAHHPHIHLMMYSTNPKEGYLNNQSIDNIRGAFAKQIFKHDLMNIYSSQTYYRDQLKLSSETYIKSQIDNIDSRIVNNNEVNNRLVNLAKVLKNTSGKLVYGYLPKPTKKLVDEIVNLISHDPIVKELLDMWYLQRQEILYTYTSQKERVENLADISAFRSIKNMVIREALNIPLQRSSFEIRKDMILMSYPNEIPLSTNQDYIEVRMNHENYMFPESIDLNPLSLDNNFINDSLKSSQLNTNDINYIEVENQQASSDNTTHSIRLLYSISKMFQKNMIDQANKYHNDKELLRNIKRKKIALGYHIDDK